jgi:hypothetical protein
MPRNRGGNPLHRRVQVVDDDDAASSYADLGYDRNYARDVQDLALVPESRVDAYIKRTKKAGEQIVISAVVKMGRKLLIDALDLNATNLLTPRATAGEISAPSGANQP